MTPEQRYEENESLVYHSIKKAFGSFREAERRAKNRHMELTDLEQIAKEQLWKCAVKYDDAHKIAFTTYSIPNLVWRMKQELNRRGHLVHIPRYNDKQNKSDRVVGVKVRYFSMMINNDGESTLEDILPDYTTHNAGYKRVLFTQLLDLLSEKERTAILLTLNGAMQKEVALTLGIKQGSVSRVIERAANKMRKGTVA